MLTLKRFLCALLTLCSLPILAADSTIGNLTPITTVPDAYRMPWENPGVVDYYITFASLTNQILAGYASQAYANGAAQSATNGYPWGSLYYPMTSNPSNFVSQSTITNVALLNGTNLFTKTNIFEMDALGTTIVPTVILTNGTTAALGAQQVSPALMFGGQGWRSGNSTTMPVQMGMYVLPVQGSSANATASLVITKSVSNAAPSAVVTLSDNGSWDELRSGLIRNSGSPQVSFNSVAGTLANVFYFGWSNDGFSAGTRDVSLYRVSAGVLGVGAGSGSGQASLVASNVTASGVITATNNITWQAKSTFTTNFTATTNIAIYCCSGTNQLITLPNCTTTPPFQIYRFSSTNGYGSFILTNATGTQTIRDGTSLSFTQIGIGSPSFYHDGAHWWPAARTKTIMANAQFSCSTNIPMTLATTAYPVTFNSTDFNNSQGIALLAGTNGLLSKMWITNSGEYEFSPSIVINFNGNNTVTTWFRSNGTNVPNSATAIRGAAGGSVRCVTIPFVVSVEQPTAFELWVLSSSTGDALSFQAAGGVAPNDYPLSPSVICPVKKISDHYP